VIILDTKDTKDTKIYNDKIEYFSAAEYMHVEPVSTDINFSQEEIELPEATHGHDDIELIYVISGTGTLMINGISHTLADGSMAHLLQYHIHSISPDKGSTLHIYRCRYSLGILMTFSLTQRSQKKDGFIFEFGSPVVECNKKEMGIIKNNFDIIASENARQDELFEMIVLSSLMQNVYIFQRRCLKSIQNDPQYMRGLAWEVLQYLQVNFTRDLDSAKVAQKFDIKIPELNSILRILTGENFSQNQHRVRIRNACAMMAYEDLSVQYIGRYVGYSTTAAFYRAFKKLRGITPDNYRKAHSSEIANGVFDVSYSIILYIYRNYSEPITLKTASEELFISQAKIEKIINNTFKTTFFQMLTIIRIQYACSLLCATSLSVSDVAYSVGFTSLRTFSRSFLSETGTNATTYRKTQTESL